jgi:ribosomal protein S18 acetylase RimI-like enzyme
LTSPARAIGVLAGRCCTYVHIRPPHPRRKAIVPAAEITFQLLDGRQFDGRQAAQREAELQALNAEVCSGQPDAADDGATGVSGSLRVQRRQPGFVLAEARSGGYLVGYATGMPLRPSTSWWRELTSPLPDEFTAEHPGRTFALTGLAVRAAWRRQGIGAYLHGLILSGRPEERATLMVPPTATAAQAALQSWGWRKVARSRGSEPGSPASDVLVIALPADTR